MAETQVAPARVVSAALGAIQLLFIDRPVSHRRSGAVERELAKALYAGHGETEERPEAAAVDCSRSYPDAAAALTPPIPTLADHPGETSR